MTERHTRKYLGWFLIILLVSVWFGTDLSDITDDLLLQLRIGLAGGLVTGVLLLLAAELLSFRREVGAFRRLGEGVGIGLAAAIIWLFMARLDYHTKWVIRGGHMWLMVLELSACAAVILAVVVSAILERRRMAGTKTPGKGSA